MARAKKVEQVATEEIKETESFDLEALNTEAVADASKKKRNRMSSYDKHLWRLEELDHKIKNAERHLEKLREDKKKEEAWTPKKNTHKGRPKAVKTQVAELLAEMIEKGFSPEDIMAMMNGGNTREAPDSDNTSNPIDLTIK